MGQWPSYSSAEVLRLLAMTEAEAIALSGGLESGLGRLSATGKPSGSSGDDEPAISLYARWKEVTDAAAAVVERGDARRARDDDASTAAHLDMLRLRGKGLTVREVADRVKVSSASAHRWAGTLLDAIVVELGGEPFDGGRSIVPACMKCGEYPRARVAPVLRRGRVGQRLVAEPERLSSLCAACKLKADVAAAASKRRSRR